VLFAHGRYDPVVPYELGRVAFSRLEKAGYSASWSAFDMEHSLCLDEVQRIAGWLRERFPAP
jgi:phospholipase/carboxylesterase